MTDSGIFPAAVVVLGAVTALIAPPVLQVRLRRLPER